MLKRYPIALNTWVAVAVGAFVLALSAFLVLPQLSPDSVSAQDTGRTYVEGGTGPVAYYTASDPEGMGVYWSVRGTDAADFEISSGGELRFKKSPNFERPSDRIQADDAATTEDESDDANNNVYNIVVVATDRLATNDPGPAKSSELAVAVTVTDKQEAGGITLNRVQIREGAAVTATLSDPDVGQDTTSPVVPSSVVWAWSVPSVSNPRLTTDSDWRDAGAGTTDAAEYTPVGTDAGKVLRVKVTYTDAKGSGQEAYAKLDYPVLAALGGGDTNIAPLFGDTSIDIEVAEDLAVGMNVGDPVTATDADSDRLTYTLGGAQASYFDIDANGQITVKTKLDHELAGVTDGAYAVTVTATDPSGSPTATPAGVTITVTDVNEVPAVSLDGTATNTGPSIPEATSGDFSRTYTATDPESDSWSFGSLEGPDSGDFFLASGGELTFIGARDYEMPADANKDNIYEVTVVATDAKGLSGRMAVSVTITNSPETGELSLMPEQPSVKAPVTATLTDPDGEVRDIVWTWWKAASPTASGATDWTYIPDATGRVYVPVAGDVGSYLRVQAAYRDAASPEDDAGTADTDESIQVIGGAVDTTANTIAGIAADDGSAVTANSVLTEGATAANDPPKFANDAETREIPENTAVGGNAGAPVKATDPDGDALEYALSGTGSDKFNVDENGQIKVAAALDYETTASYELTLTAEDPNSLSDTVTVTIDVTNVNDAPGTPTGDATKNYVEGGTGAVASYTASDPEGMGVYWSVRGTDAADFEISSGGELRFKKSPNFERPSDRIQADDAATTEDESDDANNNVYNIVVVATDRLATNDPGPAKSSELAVAVTVTDKQEAGGITLNRVQIREGAAVTATLSDPDVGQDTTSPVVPSSVVWAWSVPSVSNPRLTTDSDWRDAGAGTTDAAEYTPVGTDAGKVLRVKVTYTDAKGSGQEAYAKLDYPVLAALGGGDTNIAPLFGDTSIDIEVAEDLAVGMNVGDPVTATDADSDRLTYTLGGAQASYFDIDANGQITVKTKLDHELAGVTDGAYAVTVTATDPSGSPTATPAGVTITVTDVNEVPAVSLDGTATNTGPSIPEATSGDFSRTYTATDPESDSWSFGSLEGPDSGDFFLASGGELTFIGARDYEMPADANKDNIYEVTVVATDAKGLSGRMAVSVTITNSPETGELSLMPEQPSVKAPVTATLTDPDGEVRDIVWTWWKAASPTASGATDWTYIPDATGRVYVPVAGDVGSYLRVQAAYRDAASPEDDAGTADTDESIQVIGGAVDTTANTIAGIAADDGSAVTANSVLTEGATAANDPPKFANDAETREIPENTAVGGNAGAPVKATDPDGDALEYALSGTGSDKFNVDENGQIKVAAALDYETTASYELTLTAEDPNSLSDTVTVTIDVTNVNDAPGTPMAITGALVIVGGGENLSSPEIVDSTATMAVLHTYRTAGSASGQEAWSLSGDDATAFSIDASSGELTFAAAPDYENPADADTDNMYEVTVVASAGSSRDTASVTVTVTNVEEMGTVTFTPDTAPQVGMEVTASVADPDLGVTGETWQWSKSDAMDGTFADINGATMAAYTPVDADDGMFLKATATYTDTLGSGKMAEAVTAEEVGAAASAVTRYDTNGTPGIQRDEAINALFDYFDDEIDRDAAVEVIFAYLGL